MADLGELFTTVNRGSRSLNDYDKLDLIQQALLPHVVSFRFRGFDIDRETRWRSGKSSHRKRTVIVAGVPARRRQQWILIEWSVSLHHEVDEKAILYRVVAALFPASTVEIREGVVADDEGVRVWKRTAMIKDWRRTYDEGPDVPRAVRKGVVARLREQG